MKKTALLTGMLLFFVGTNAWGQEPPPPPPPGGEDPGAAPAPVPPPPGYAPAPQPYAQPQPIPVRIVEPPEPQWKYRLSLNLTLPATIQLDVGLTPRIGLLFGVGGMSIMDFYWVDVVAGISFYLRGHAPRGFWIGVKIANGWMGWDDDPFLYSFVAKALFGYNWIWRSGFSFGLGLGAQYWYVKVESGDFKFPLDGFMVTWDMTIGWGF